MAVIINVMERFDFDKLSGEVCNCDIDIDIVRLEKNVEYAYPKELELELDGWVVLTDTNGGQNKVRLFRKCDIIDSDRFKRGEPWIRRKEIMRWIKKVNSMPKMGGFNRYQKIYKFYTIGRIIYLQIVQNYFINI